VSECGEARLLFGIPGLAGNESIGVFISSNVYTREGASESYQTLESMSYDTCISQRVFGIKKWQFVIIVFSLAGFVDRCGLTVLIPVCRLPIALFRSFLSIWRRKAIPIRS
jgi:hypothetical protein